MIESTLLESDKVALIPLNSTNIDDLRKLRNQFMNTDLIRDNVHISKDEQQKWFLHLD